jgi:hypothetical protein
VRLRDSVVGARTPSAVRAPERVSNLPLEPRIAPPLIAKVVRRHTGRSSGYGVFFGPLAGEIIVYAVFHGARDPHAWKRRRNA